jgi:hypothetical protein
MLRVLLCGVFASNWNCTLTTPTVSVALAVTATVPETVLPPEGDVMLTLGGVVSEGGGGAVAPVLPPQKNAFTLAVGVDSPGVLLTIRNVTSPE